MELGWLCVVLGGLMVVTLIGHGIWVFIASLFKAAKPRPAPHTVGPGVGAGVDDLSRTAAQITQFLDAGLIDAATHQRVMAAVLAMRQRRTPPPIPVLPLPAAGTIVEHPVPAPTDPTPAPRVVPTQPIAPGAQSIPELVARHVDEAAPLRPVPRAAPAQRRPLSEVLVAFMRQSNIRWGELVGGLLIVGCSIALVISFWNQIAGKPFFQFGIFTTVTAALLGLGLYAEHRWKLPTTSRGILLIATLLVPLNFLAFAAVAHGAAASTLVTCAEVAALALFGFLVWRAAQVLSPHWPELMAGGVLGASVSLLLTKHFGPARSTAGMLGLAGVAVALYAAPISAMLARARHWKQVRQPVAEGMLLLLGVLTFATALAVGLVIFQSDDPLLTARRLSPLLSLACVPSLASGLLLWRGVSDRRLGRTRTAGTAVGVAAAFLMLGAIGLAWPDPAGLLPLAAIDFLALSAVALLFEIPAAHLLAGACLIFGYLLGFHVLWRHVGWTSIPQQMLDALIAPSGGPALIPLFALTVGASLVFSRHGRGAESSVYALLSGAVAAISLGLVTWSGFARLGDPYGTTWVYATYAMACFGVAWRLRRADVSWVAWMLLLAAFVQFFASRHTGLIEWATALLAFASVAVAMSAVARVRSGEGAKLLAQPARSLAFAVSAVAAALLLVHLSFQTAGDVSVRLLWLSAIWLVLAWVEQGLAIFTAGQIAMAAAVAIGALARLATRPWFAESAVPLLEPWTLQTLGVALGALSVGGAVLRLALPPTLVVSRWIRSDWAFDRILTVVIAAGAAGLSLVALAPAIQAEFATHPGAAVIDPPALHAAGAGSWAMLGIAVLLLVMWTWREATPAAMVLTVALAAFACPLWAARWADVSAGASALRWSLAFFLAVMSLPLWLRTWLPGKLRATFEKNGTSRDYRLLLAAVAAVPVLALSAYPAASALQGSRIAGPAATCFFGAIGNSLSYCVPLLVVGSVFVGHAVRERSSGWAFAASGVCNFTVTLGYLLSVATSGAAFDLLHLIRLVQLNALTLGGFALAWQAVRSIRRRSLAPDGRIPALLRAEIALAWLGNALLLVPAAAWLIVTPRSAGAYLATVGDPLGWLALAAALGSAGWTSGWKPQRLSAPAIAAGFGSLALMIAFAAGHWNQANWLSYHVLMTAAVAACSATLAAGVWISRSRAGWPEEGGIAESQLPASNQPVALQYQRADRATGAADRPAVYVGGEQVEPAFLRCTAAFSALVVLLALRAMAGDPQRPWWSATATVLLSLLWTAIACWAAAPRLLYIGGALLNLAATFWFVDKPFVRSAAPLLDLIAANIVVTAFAGLAALVLHVQVFARSSRLGRAGGLPFHRFAAMVSTVAAVALASLTLWSDLVGRPLTGAVWMTCAAVGSSGLLAAATMVWEGADIAAGELYLLGLAGVALVAHPFANSSLPAQWAIGTTTACYVLLTGAIYAARNSLARFLRRPSVGASAPLPWLAWANLLLAGIVVLVSCRADLVFTRMEMRLTLATAALAQVVGLVLAAHGDRRLDVRLAALVIAAGAAVAWGWAWMQPAEQPVLDRSVAAMLALAVAGATYLLSSSRLVSRQPLWAQATRTVGMWLAGACAASLAAIVALETGERIAEGAAAIHPAAVGAMIVAIVAAAMVAVVLALNPQRDPLRLRDAPRGAYIYAAEGLLGLLFVHLRVTMPWLFGGLFAQYWPLVVMGIAFAGVALGELFRRRRSTVLSEPLLRTGVFLPLLPVLAFWAAPSHVELSNLLFVIGVFYAILSAMRQSFAFGVLAALAANGGLWALLARQPQLAFLVHPQLWLIPAAVSVLAAAQLNRDRLAPARLRFIRYACLMLVYISSTADIFLNGVQRAPWLPLVLAALSVGGVMIGILFRMRPFLFLGTAFLGLAVVTMIYYASANLGWTWLWYVAGIGLGSAIIATFALFEKKRAGMLAMVEGLKAWE